MDGEDHSSSAVIVEVVQPEPLEATLNIDISPDGKRLICGMDRYRGRAPVAATSLDTQPSRAMTSLRLPFLPSPTRAATLLLRPSRALGLYLCAVTAACACTRSSLSSPTTGCRATYVRHL